jgi:hypothetical protein
MLNSELRLVLMTSSHCCLRHLVEHAVARDAGVVDQDVDGAEILLDLLDGLFAQASIARHVPLVDGNAGFALKAWAAASLPA